MKFIVDVIKIDNRRDSRREGDLCLQASAEGGPALLGRSIRFLQTITTVPTQRRSSANGVSHSPFKIRTAPVAISVVRSEFGAAPERATQSWIKDVVDARDSEMGRGIVLQSHGRGDLERPNEHRRYNDLAFVFVTDNAITILHYQYRCRHKLQAKFISKSVGDAIR